MFINNNCTGINIDNENNTNCDNFEESACHNQISNDFLRNHLLHSDDFIINILKNTMNVNESHLMAAINYYRSCITNSKEEKSSRKEKIVQLISSLFNGWLSPLDSDKISSNISNNIPDDKLFNLTNLILPLIFQNGRTTIFSLNVVRSRNKNINLYIYSVNNGEGIEEQIFKLLENFEVGENKEELAKGVFNLYSDIQNVLEIFDQLKITLIQLLSSNSWFNENNKGTIDQVKNISLSIISSESLNVEERENKDFIFNNKILENNYFMNAYYAQKTKLLKSFGATLHKYDEPEVSSFTPYISGLDKDYNIQISTGFLHPPYFNGSYSMSEKYGIIGWIIGRELMSAVSGEDQINEPEQSQFICEATDLESFESQLCCLQKQNSFRMFGKKNFRSLSNDINGLMLSFTTYRRICMQNRKNLDGELFFTTFAKV
ncbi:unnamed protein product [Schistosoma spindalis]|nr:unnamed protein product [Schistosoma spindale]